MNEEKEGPSSNIGAGVAPVIDHSLSPFYFVHPSMMNEIVNGTKEKSLEVAELLPDFVEQFKKCTVPTEGQSVMEHQNMVMKNIDPWLQGIKKLSSQVDSIPSVTEQPLAFPGDDINEFLAESDAKIKKDLVTFTTSFVGIMPLICVGIYSYHTCPSVKDAVDLTTSLSSLGSVFFIPLCSMLNSILNLSRYTRKRAEKMNKLTLYSSSIPSHISEAVATTQPVISLSVSNEKSENIPIASPVASVPVEADNCETATITPAMLLTGEAVRVVREELRKQGDCKIDAVKDPSGARAKKASVGWLTVALRVLAFVAVVFGAYYLLK